MCGIAGIVAAEGRPSEPAVAAMVARLRHRGPDAEATRSFDGCCLGHSRLRIIDLSPLGDQPMASEDESVWAVFNGEIYNFRELRSELERAGHRFRSSTDTEVLVHLYEEHGDGLAGRLRGMFAVAIWDARRRRLGLWRDRLGIKPLYYRRDGAGLAFASEVRALARPGDRIDERALRGYLRLGWVPGPATLWAGVAELPPGHRLVWEDGRAGAPERWWRLPAPARGDRPPDAAELREVLLDAIGRHLVADVDVGLFLSSGVDSVVLARLSALAGQRPRAYTVSFGGAADESAAAAAFAARLGLDHTVVPVGEDDALAAAARFATDLDQPTVDGLNSWLVARAVRDAGLIVALSGVGGDELFGGYSTFRHVPRLARAARMASGAPALSAALAGVLARHRRTEHWRGRRAMEAVAVGGLEAAYASVRGLFGRTELDRLWPAGAGVGEAGLLHLDPDGPTGPAAVGRLELANYLPFQLLRDTDVMSMAHALEVRVPLLDDEVVRVAVRGQASGTAWSKRVLIDAVDPTLAPLLAGRKRTFTLPIAGWMRGGLYDRTEAALVSLGQSDLGFSRRQLTEVWHGFLAGRVGWRPVWALAVLGQWLDQRAGDARRPLTVPA